MSSDCTGFGCRFSMSTLQFAFFEIKRGFGRFMLLLEIVER
jgi:hypothetical protein